MTLKVITTKFEFSLVQCNISFLGKRCLQSSGKKKKNCTPTEFLLIIAVIISPSICLTILTYKVLRMIFQTKLLKWHYLHL